jgi:DNA-binding beta-propeller fold protein YncE
MYRRLIVFGLVWIAVFAVPRSRPGDRSPAGVALAPPAGGVELGAVLRENGCADPSAPQQTWPGWDGPMPGGDVPPARIVRDPYPTFHGVAVDAANNRVVMSDSNRHGLLAYARTAGSAAGKDAAEPLSNVRGPVSGMMFVASVALDPARREMYTVDNDIGDRLLTFPYDADGNVRPSRVLDVPHQAWGIGISQKRDEVAISVESSRLVVVYRRGASGATPPLRVLRGPATGLGDPHGVNFDDVHDEIVVANHGNQTAGATRRPMETAKGDASGRGQADTFEGGRFEDPSLTVYRADAGGNAEPLRRIQGPLTGLNWPMGISVDAEHGEIAVANNGDSSIRVFSRSAAGNVAPVRVIKGARTGVSGPMGVAIDTVNGELWVTNYGDHTALVFPRTATGNVAPTRIVRNAPAGAPTSGFGNPGAVAYDTKRGEILVPN